MTPQILPIKTLKRQYVPKIFEEKSLPKSPGIEICTKNLRRAILYQISLEEQTYSKNYSEEKIFTKNLRREITTKKESENNIYPKISKETFRAKRLERGISSRDLPKNLRKQFCQNLIENSLPKTL